MENNNLSNDSKSFLESRGSDNYLEEVVSPFLHKIVFDLLQMRPYNPVNLYKTHLLKFIKFLVSDYVNYHKRDRKSIRSN